MKNYLNNNKWQRKILSFVLSLAMVWTMIPGLFGAGIVYAEAGDKPDHAKTSNANKIAGKEDGTYQLELSVTGDADTKQEASNVNILVVYDVSSSMCSYWAESDTGWYGTTSEYWRDGNYLSNNGNTIGDNTTVFNLYKRSGNTYTRIQPGEIYEGTVYRRNGNNYSVFNAGTGNNRRVTARRADVSEKAVYGLVDDLFDYQNEDKTNINMGLITFDGTAHVTQPWTTNETDITNKISNTGTSKKLTYASGTNWEGALRAAQTQINSLDNDYPTYVLFITDGSPSTEGNGGSTGGPDTYPGHALAAYDEARELNTREETYLYGIYAFGDDYDYLDDLMYYAGTGERRQQRPQTDPADNYYNAGNTEALNEAISNIFGQIVQALGISAVEIKDGTTHEVSASSGMIELLEVDESSYQYWLSVPIVDGKFQRVKLNGDNAGETITYTVTDNGNGTCTVTWVDGGNKSVTVNGTKTNTQFKYEWTEANALYNQNPPEAHLNGSSVDWNLSAVGTLLDGVTYSVTFDVWPSQTTLDYIADIENGYYDQIPSEVKQYIDKDGKLQTNTTATLSYKDTRTGETDSLDYTNPDPVESTAVEQLAVAKEWTNDIDGQQSAPIDLEVTRDGTHKYDIILSEDNQWKGNVYISIGIMRTDKTTGEMEVLEPGHDFTFVEPKNIGYRWELDIPTIRPMLIDGTLTMLIKVDENHQPGDAKVYKDPFGNGADYYEGSTGAASLTATNYRRSQIALTKAVTGDAPADAKFPFTLSVTNSRADTGTEGDTDSDKYVWFLVADKNGTTVKSQEYITGGATAEMSGGSFTGFYYAESGASISAEIPAGYSIRFINLPTDSSYTFTEGNLATGFKFVKAELTGGSDQDKDEEFVVDGKTATGKIAEWNADYLATFTNDYELTDVTVTKAWDDSSNADGCRPTSLDLTLNGVPEGTSVPQPEITKNGNNWTYTWKELPKYNAAGETINYTVTETTIPAGYTCNTTTVNAGGTITNSHTPEMISIPVRKVWDDEDDNDGIRPSSVKVDVKAGSEIVTGKTLTLDESNQWSGTFTDLPKYKDGTEIVYTVVEQTDNVITGEDGDGTYAISYAKDESGQFIVTNTHTPTLTNFDVTKVWVDANNRDGYRPETVTVQLLANNEPYGDPVVLTETPTEAQKEQGYGAWYYQWKDLPVKSDGQDITYSVRENSVDHYKPTYTASESGGGMVITNTHETDVVSYTITKVWDDGNNQDGTRPDKLTVKLMADGEQYGETIDLIPEPTEAQKEQGYGPWSYTWTGLDKNPEIPDNVTVVEEPAPDDTDSTGEDQNGKAAEVEEPETESEESALTDKEAGADDKAAETDSVEGADGGPDAVETVKDEQEEAGKGDGSIAAVEKSASEAKAAKANVTAIKYEADETKVPSGYKKTVVKKEDYSITIQNSYTPQKTKVSVTKTWADNSDQDRIRPANATIELFKTVDGEKNTTGKTAVVGSTENTWQTVFENLPVYENGKKITYSVVETLPANSGYTKSGDETTLEAIPDDSGTIAITNTHTPSTVNLPGTKTWDDSNDQDGKRPDYITVKLIAEGITTVETTVKVVLSGELAEGDIRAQVDPDNENKWNFSFGGLPEFEQGVKIVYSIVETAVDANYQMTSEEGDPNIVNKHETEKMQLTVKKVWSDADDQDGKRASANATVQLYKKVGTADAVPVDSEEVISVGTGDNWSNTWRDLPVYEGGNKITYSVVENLPENSGYTKSGDDATVEAAKDKQGEITITNSHTPEKISVPVQKVWEDSDNKSTARPDSVTFQLYKKAEGSEGDPQAVLGKKLTLTAANAKVTEDAGTKDENIWTGTFADLPKYEGGKELTYTIKEMTGSDAGATAIAEGGTLEGKKAGYDYTVSYSDEDGVLTVTNTLETVDIEITKDLLQYVDHYNSVEGKVTTTFVFKITGTKEGVKNPVYSSQVGIQLDTAGTASKKLNNLPKGLTYTVEEVYSGSYTASPSSKTLGEADLTKEGDKYIYKVKFENSGTDIEYGGGVINKYTKNDDGTAYGNPDPKGRVKGE